MRMTTRWLGTMLVGTTLAVAAIALAQATKPGAGAAPDRTALVARGEYLVTVMGCNDCHTPGTLFGGPDFKRRLAGSELGWKGPWGVTFARNLTPDQDTGLGYWSAKEIVTALRTGVKPDGSVMKPPMPWPNLAILSDADAAAIAAYLMSLPRVQHEVPPALAPGKPWTGATLEFPTPGAWDAPAPAGK